MGPMGKLEHPPPPPNPKHLRICTTGALHVRKPRQKASESIRFVCASPRTRAAHQMFKTFTGCWDYCHLGFRFCQDYGWAFAV